MDSLLGKRIEESFFVFSPSGCLSLWCKRQVKTVCNNWFHALSDPCRGRAIREKRGGGSARARAPAYSVVFHFDPFGLFCCCFVRIYRMLFLFCSSSVYKPASCLSVAGSQPAPSCFSARWRNARRSPVKTVSADVLPTGQRLTYRTGYYVWRMMTIRGGGHALILFCPSCPFPRKRRRIRRNTAHGRSSNPTSINQRPDTFRSASLSRVILKAF